MWRTVGIGLLLVAVILRTTNAAPYTDSQGAGPLGPLADALLGPTNSTNSTNCQSDTAVCCTDNPVDIYFLLDCSSSIWIVDYKKQLQFVVNLVKHFHINSDATRVGLGVFSNDYRPIIELGSYNVMGELERAILATPYLTGNTYTEKGIRGIRTVGFRNARKNVTKIAIVVTDGKSQSRTATMDEARLAKEDKIWMFSIGVGNSVDGNELAAIASEPTEEFRYMVPSYDILITLADRLAISTCSINVPQADGAVCGQKKKADIIFVYNAAAISSRNVDHIKNFIRYAAGEFSMSTGNVRAGVISQGSNGADIMLNQYLRREDFLTAISGLPKAPSYDALLKRVRNIGFEYGRGARQDAIKMAVLFVDDVVNNARDDAKYEALLLRYDDVLIHVVAIGNQYNQEEVKSLATSSTFVTTFTTYDELQNTDKQKQFLDKLCQYL